MYKDEVLDQLASNANVAQFVSFGPGEDQRYSRVFGYNANIKFKNTISAVEALLGASPEASINVRSFKPDQLQGNEFHYGIKDSSIALAHIRRLTSEGFFVIINETIDVDDGGVSGALQGGCIEFAPGVTPRFVEKDSDTPIPSLPIKLALDLLEIVYGFRPDLDYHEGHRVEFSIHPKARGWCHQHTIIWEVEELEEISIPPHFVWPNPFSQFLGDKVYGLLVAALLGAPVPRVTSFSRNPLLPIYTFGSPTGSGSLWTRTCPKVQEPGRFTTVQGWEDPYALMDSDDPERRSIASCLVQEGVESLYSGALITDADGKRLVEGVRGFGDRFMQGEIAAEALPEKVLADLNSQYDVLSKTLEDVRFEWAHDGSQVWILQLHKGRSISSGRIIVPGEASSWLEYKVGSRLSELRSLVEQALQTGSGINVIGHVGMSSHVADVLRKASIPAKMIDQ
ncbi:MAG: hypothetical protein CL942_08740 [Desulfovibrio sp.]|nr:hypothetical protein [Desulfovibrio sp.]|tara:strand:+ start:10986 stop:12347 length:1362 start_codon:yes stop_codon:yes gene_type:complete